MAELIINTDHIIGNIQKINSLIKKHQAQWTLISKVLSGHKETLQRILSHPSIDELHSIGDSRLSSLEMIKKIRPDIETMYIKPVPQNLVNRIVRHADISLTSSLSTLRLLDEAASKIGVKHKVIVMIELGELREGIVRDNIVEFYSKAFKLENIDVMGIGTNLGCMYGIEPTYDKMIQLTLYRALLQEMFHRKLPIISGGSSITIPMIGGSKLPSSINHFRIGEAVFCGSSPLDNQRFKNLSTEVFEYSANILELEEKESTPDGIISEAAVGHVPELSEDRPEGETHCRAIVDFGLLDVDVDAVSPKDSNIHFAGTTSDLTVFEIKNNLEDNGRTRYHVGDRIRFVPTYMGSARLMNSKFITKKVTGKLTEEK